MTRFLCCSLLLVVALPVFAQNGLDPMITRGNQDAYIRMQQQLTQELQQVQRMLSVIPPGETQYIEMMKTQQAELMKQLKDVAQQLQAFEIPPETANALQGRDARIPEMPAMPPVDPRMPGMGGMPQQPMSPWLGQGQTMPMQPPVRPYSDIAPVAPPQTIVPYTPPMPNPTWGDQNQAWGGNNPWGPNPAPSKELVEMKQSVDAMRKEIAELKETVKTLETQIQLLNRNIVLSDRAREQ